MQRQLYGETKYRYMQLINAGTRAVLWNSARSTGN